jgi:transcriptional regulator with XRE-family HTH domain
MDQTAEQTRHPDRERFAKRLRELRVPRGFRTARSLARALGIDENRYTRYERAEVEPDLALLVRICEMLQLTPNDLLCDNSARALAPGVARLAAGFAERSDRAAYRVTPVAAAEPRRTPSGAEAAQSLLVRQRAVAWRLARLLASLEGGVAIGVGADGVGRGSASTVQAASRYFEAIDADPFAFVTRLAVERLGALPVDDQARASVLIDELMEAVSAAAETARARRLHHVPVADPRVEPARPSLKRSRILRGRQSDSRSKTWSPFGRQNPIPSRPNAL